MKKSELRQLIREIVKTSLQENITYRWKDGSELVLDYSGNPIDGVFNGKKVTAGWKYLGYMNSWKAADHATYDAHKNEKWLEINLNKNGTLTGYYSPSSKIFFKVDSSG